MPNLCLISLLSAVSLASAFAGAAVTDHSEFEASLVAPYRGDAGHGDARTFTLVFEYPGLSARRQLAWTLELLDARGAVRHRWQGTTALGNGSAHVEVAWDGRLAGGHAVRGAYTVRLRATLDDGTSDQQAWEILAGPPPAPHPTAALAAPPAGVARDRGTRPRRALAAYNVYYGNLHSQTNHSDGGGEVETCHGAQDPQTAWYGPGDAYTFARAHGLDFLMTSEHNHMYDGSDGTNAAADAEWPRMLYRSGLTAANDFNTQHPDFLALYGMEWGVIGNGGHLNILNAPELLGWERNAGGDLLADLYTARSDYASLYALMRRRGWIGQFNHPTPTGQFVINGVPLAYSDDGDQVMALCEVLNTSAFSSQVNENETSRRTYEDACNRALEAGYHVAFSSDQDNHCANWGASYGNRTAVLVPAGRPLTTASFLEAVQARRVFATMDKTAKLMLAANGHVMGERFANSGALELVVDYASSAGKQVAAVAVMEGVPGRNGKVTQLSSEARTVLTPAPGEHFYYAKVTQEDGNVLWSAPVWVTQSADGQNP